MRTLQKYFCLILTAMVLIVPDLCHAARNVAQRNTDEITQHDVSQNVTSGGRTTNRATTNTARAGNNARRESSTSRRESSSRGTASRTSNAGARATQSRTARTAQAGRTSAVTARNASAQVRSATNTRAARSAATAHGAPTTAVKSRAATSVQPRASANDVMARTRNASAVSLVNNNIADLMAQCKTKYTQCMDDFCNVLDDAQGRCSCSKNLKNYAKTSTAQDEANAALQDIAQQIRYIGLSRDEVEIVFKQTEAELALQGSSDNSQIKNSLDKIKDMIVEVKPGTASSADADTGFSFNLDGLLDFSFDSIGFDLTSLFGTNSANTSSISNQRGEQLYKTASARCKKNVLDACQAQGINTVLIENSYDLEIDRACIAYEKELTGGNDNIAQTVRNAQSVLQRARLMVAQQKNIYDLRKCVGALDSCMQDDFVCGGDYELCLDPTGKYIVEGEVVVGSTPGYTSNANPASDYAINTLMGTWYYDNKFAWAPTPQEGSLIEYIAKYVTSKPIKNTSSNIAEFLQYKIGYNEDGKNYGMCMSVLNKCQDLTYDKTSGKYIPNNQVVTEYLTRTLTQIKSAQDKILFEYAESCITDVASCLSSNNFDTATTEKKQNIAINACRAQIKTCMSVNGNSSSDPGELRNWVVSMMGAYDEEDGSRPATPGQAGSSVPGAEDYSSCVASGGTWFTTTQTCTCDKVGTIKNAAKKICECDKARNFAGKPDKDSGCSCASGYELVGTECVLVETGDDPKPGQSTCTESGGSWSNESCSCKAPGTIYDHATAACICNTAGNFAGTPDKDSGCSCADGYELVGTQCVSEETPGQSTCTASGGSWSNEGCSCKAPGTIYDHATAACICNTANNFAGTPTSMGCQCAEGYEFVNDVCQLKETGGESGGGEPEQPEQPEPEPEQPSIAQQNCENTGGEWNASESSCSCDKVGTTRDSTQNLCVCNTYFNFAGEATQDGCNCKEGYVLDKEAEKCKLPKQIECEQNEDTTWNGQACECKDKNLTYYNNRCMSLAEYRCVATKGQDDSGNGITGIWSNGTCECPGELKWYEDKNDCESVEDINCWENGGRPVNGGCDMCSGPEYENKFVHYNKNTNQCILVENDAYWCSLLGGNMDGNVCKIGGVTYWNSANGPSCRDADATNILGGYYDLYNAYLCSCKLDYFTEHSTGQLVDDKCACLYGFVRKSIDLCSCPDDEITFTTSVSDYESTELIYKAVNNVSSVQEMPTGTVIDLPVVSSAPFYAQKLGRSIELADWFIRDGNNNIVTMQCNIYKSDGHYHCNSMCITEEKLGGICEASGGTWDSKKGCTSCSGMGMGPNMIKDFSIYTIHHEDLSGKNLLCSCNVDYMWVADPDKRNSCRCPEYVSKTGVSIQLQPMTESDMQDANDPKLWGLDSMPEWDEVYKCVLPGTLIVHANPNETNEYADYHWACDEKHGFVDSTTYEHQSTVHTPYEELLKYLLQGNTAGYAPRCVCKAGLTQVYDAAKQKHVCVEDES